MDNAFNLIQFYLPILFISLVVVFCLIVITKKFFPNNSFESILQILGGLLTILVIVFGGVHFIFGNSEENQKPVDTEKIIQNNPNTALFNVKTSQNLQHEFSDSWKRVTTKPEWDLRYNFRSISMQDGSIIVIGGQSSQNSSIYLNDIWRSTDDGKKWELMTSNIPWGPRLYYSLLSLPNGKLMIMGGLSPYEDDKWYNDVWVSSDSGKNWKLITSHAEWSPRIFASSTSYPDGNIIMMGGELPYQNGSSGYLNEVWFSSNGGANWTLKTENAEWSPRTDIFSSVIANKNLTIMGGFLAEATDVGKDIWISQDQGETWKRISYDNSIYPGQKYLMSPKGYLIRTNGYEIKISYDGGVNWEKESDTKAEWMPRNDYQLMCSKEGSIIVICGVPSEDSPWGNSGVNGNSNDIWELDLK